MFDLLRQERIKGKILEKYSLNSGNIGIIVEDEYGRRYSVEFRTNYIQPRWENLYRIIKEPFKGKGEYIEKLIGDTYIDLTTSYSKSPIKYAYYLHAVSSEPLYNRIRNTQRYPRLAYNTSGSGY